MDTVAAPADPPKEIERAFEARSLRLHAGSNELCNWCGRGLHSLLYLEWRRIGMALGWDPADPARHDDYGRLFANLAKMHRAHCKPVDRYDTWWYSQGKRVRKTGTRQESKAMVMGWWFGVEPQGWDEAMV